MIVLYTEQKAELLNREPQETDPPVVPGSQARTELPRRKLAARRPVRISGKTVPDGYCELVGLDAGVLYVQSERRIPETSPVTVSFDHTQLSGYVTECQPTEREWVIAIALASGRRREARIPTGEEYTVGIVGNRGTRRCRATVIDRSSSVLGLLFSRAVAPGTRVYVEMESVMALGEIRHCRATPDGQFIAGVAIAEFIPDVRSRSRFRQILDKIRWKLGSGFRSRGAPPQWPGR
jgi:hypothetical protein